MRAVALVFAVAFAGAVALTAITQPAAMDFIAQYAAATLAATGRGASVVDPAAIQAAERAAAPERVALLPFVQPPAIALLLAPLASLPYATALAVGAALDAALVAIAVAVLRPQTGRISLALLLAAPPAALAVAHAQTVPLVLLLLAFAMRSRDLPAGIALGLTLLRPQTAPLLLLAGLFDHARRVWTILGAAFVIAGSVAVVGIDGLVRYVGVLLDASQWSVTGELGLARAIGWSSLGWGSAGILLAGIGLVAGAIAVARARPETRVEVAATWSLIASPHVLMHDGLLLYPALISLASRRTAWDAAVVLVWVGHLVIAPIAPIWSLVVAIRRSAYARSRP